MAAAAADGRRRRRNAPAIEQAGLLFPPPRSESAMPYARESGVANGVAPQPARGPTSCGGRPCECGRRPVPPTEPLPTPRCAPRSTLHVADAPFDRVSTARRPHARKRKHGRRASRPTTSPRCACCWLRTEGGGEEDEEEEEKKTKPLRLHARSTGAAHRVGTWIRCPMSCVRPLRPTLPTGGRGAPGLLSLT